MLTALKQPGAGERQDGHPVASATMADSRWKAALL
jgi:hypothetical protein